MTHQASRRSFLRRVAGTAAFLPSAAATLGELRPLLAAAPTGEAYWQMVREQFAFREDKVPMNAANLCPSPRAVAERVSELTRDIDIDCSFNNRKKFWVEIEQTRSKLAEQLGVTPDEIALVRNTSEANNTVNNGLSLEAGDEIVVWEQNHPTNNVAWDVRAARFGLKVNRVSLPANPSSASQIVKIFDDACTSKTKVVTVTHVSNLSGLRLPVREIGEAAHKRGIHFHVDGAQTWGALNVNLREIGCDSYAASAHKWFCGPKEAGLLYVKADRIPRIWPNIVAPGWGDDVDPDVNGARKFESLGQRDDACLSGVGTTSDIHKMIGPARIEARMMELATALKTGLKSAGAKLTTPESAEFSGGVVIIEVPSKNRQTVLDRLYNEFGIAGSTSGGLRLCPHFYNTMEHVERAVKGVKAMRNLIV